MRPSVVPANYAQATAPAGTVVVDARGEHRGERSPRCSRAVRTTPRRSFRRASPGVGYADRPLTYALDDAKAAAIAAMTADTAANRDLPQHDRRADHRRQGQRRRRLHARATNAATTASTFLSVTRSGVTKRVPIVVVGVKPAAADEA